MDKGKAGVERSIKAAEERGKRVLGTEVTFDAGGRRTRADLVVETPDGKIQIIESKAGSNARLTKNQKEAHKVLREEGGVPRGAKAEDAGLQVGEKMEPVEVQVDQWIDDDLVDF